MRFASFLLSGLLIAAVLAGCAQAAAPSAVPSLRATATATPTSTPTPEPKAPAASIELAVGGVTALDEAGNVVAEVLFDGSVTDLVTLLTETFGGDPSVYQEDGGCWGQRQITQWSWGGDGNAQVSVFTWKTSSPSAPWREDNDFFMTVRTTEYNGIALSTAAGQSVGDSAAGVFDSVPPAALTHGYGGDQNPIGITKVGGTFDASSGTEYWGVAIEAREGSIAQIASPSGFVDFFC